MTGSTEKLLYFPYLCFFICKMSMGKIGKRLHKHEGHFLKQIQST